MIVTIKYDLENDSDRYDYTSQFNASKYRGALFEICHNLKKEMIWWMDSQENVSGSDVLEKVFEMIFEETDANGIIVDDL